MVNVNEKNFRYLSMPIHNPSDMHIGLADSCHFKADVVNIIYTVKNTDVIANIVPEPLVYRNNELSIALIMIRELMGSAAKNVALWKEIAIRIPVTFNGEPKTYICEVFNDDVDAVILDRESFGFAKVPCQVSVEKNDYNFKAKVSTWRNDRDMLNFIFKENPALGKAEKKKPSGIIIFKYIPSEKIGGPGDVKELVEMRYKKAASHKSLKGEGTIEILEGAPRYLKEAGIAEITECLYQDIELDILGGEVIHDYYKRRQKNIWQKLLKK